VLVLLAVLFFAVPFLELAVVVSVSRSIGIPETLLLLVAVSLAGAWLAKHQGLGVWRAVRRRLEAGEVPGWEMLDGLLVLVAALMLVTPGFVTDALALLLLLPPVRAAVRVVLRHRFERRVTVHTSPRVIDVRSRPPGQDFDA
jgi:UPF0716 protein FxsA